MKSIEDKKEVFSVMLNICTRVITLIFFVVTLSGAIFNKCEIHYSATDVFGILLMGLFSGLSFGIFYIKKNMTARQTIILQICYFLILNASLLGIGLYLEWFEKSVSSLVTMEIMFVLIYTIVTVLLYILDFNEAKKINQKLKDRKKNN